MNKKWIQKIFRKGKKKCIKYTCIPYSLWMKKWIKKILRKATKTKSSNFKKKNASKVKKKNEKNKKTRRVKIKNQCFPHLRCSRASAFAFSHPTRRQISRPGPTCSIFSKKKIRDHREWARAVWYVTWETNACLPLREAQGFFFLPVLRSQYLSRRSQSRLL